MRLNFNIDKKAFHYGPWSRLVNGCLRHICRGNNPEIPLAHSIPGQPTEGGCRQGYRASLYHRNTKYFLVQPTRHFILSYVIRSVMPMLSVYLHSVSHMFFQKDIEWDPVADVIWCDRQDFLHITASFSYFSLYIFLFKMFSWCPRSVTVLVFAYVPRQQEHEPASKAIARLRLHVVPCPVCTFWFEDPGLECWHGSNSSSWYRTNSDAVHEYFIAPNVFMAPEGDV